MKLVFYDYVFEQDRPGTTGLSPNAWEAAAALAALGEDVHLVGPYPPGTVAPEGVTLHSYPLPPINYRNVIGHMLIVLKGGLFIRRDIPDYDLVHAFEYLSSAALTLLGLKPVVLTTPGNIYERVHSGTNAFYVTMTVTLKVAARLSAKRCQHIIATSSAMKDWWQRTGADNGKITVQPYGVADVFRPHPQALSRVGWDGRQKHLLFVGRLSPEKGLEVLLRAWPQVVASQANVHLHVVGQGPRLESAQRLVRQLGITDRVTFHGWIDKSELPWIYSASYALVVPSFSEPLGRVILEAMASRILVIGSNVGGIPDLVKDHETGLLFNRGEVDELAQKLVWALAHEAEVEALAQAAMTYIDTYQRWPRVAQRLRDKVYRPVLEERSPHD